MSADRVPGDTGVVAAPETWVVLRGLLRALGIAALALAALSLTHPAFPPGPWEWPSPVYVGAPAALSVAALLLSRRHRAGRLAWRVVAGSAALALTANVYLVVTVGRVADELAAMTAPDCTTAAGCRSLVHETFPDAEPLVPAPVAETGLVLVEGQRSGRSFTLTYALRRSDAPALVYVIRPRALRPSDEAPPHRTQAGKPFGDDRDAAGQVRRLEMSDGDLHYTVSLQGTSAVGSDRYIAAMELLDSAH